MDSNKKLIDDLAQAAYDSGYYSGKREDGQPHHLEAIEKRRRASDRILQQLAAVSDLLAALEIIVREGDPATAIMDWPTAELFAGWAIEQAQDALAGARDGG